MPCYNAFGEPLPKITIISEKVAIEIRRLDNVAFSPLPCLRATASIRCVGNVSLCGAQQPLQ